MADKNFDHEARIISAANPSDELRTDGHGITFEKPGVGTTGLVRVLDDLTAEMDRLNLEEGDESAPAQVFFPDQVTHASPAVQAAMLRLLTATR
jgi:hypothetical protein